MYLGVSNVKKLPAKLIELCESGANIRDIELILDALLQAEDDKKQFVNVYFINPEPSFHFTNDRDDADDRMTAEAIGLEVSGDTWKERTVTASTAARSCATLPLRRRRQSPDSRAWASAGSA